MAIVNNTHESDAEDLIGIFQRHPIDMDNLLKRSNVPSPDSSTFYDGTIEEVWEDPLNKSN